MWNIDGVQLRNDRHVKYLGATLGINGSKTPIQERVRAVQRGFYAMQTVGLHQDGVDPHTAAYLNKTVIAPTLTYDCNAIYMRKNDVHELYRCQGKSIKTNLGLYRSSYTSPILQSLSIHSDITMVEKDTVDLLHRCIKGDSAARTFYSHQIQDNTFCLPKTLVARSKAICSKLDVDILKAVFSNKPASIITDDCTVSKGLINSVKYCFHYFNHNNRVLLPHLIKRC